MNPLGNIWNLQSKVVHNRINSPHTVEELTSGYKRVEQYATGKS